MRAQAVSTVDTRRLRLVDRRPRRPRVSGADRQRRVVSRPFFQSLYSHFQSYHSPKVSRSAPSHARTPLVRRVRACSCGSASSWTASTWEPAPTASSMVRAAGTTTVRTASLGDWRRSHRLPRLPRRLRRRRSRRRRRSHTTPSHRRPSLTPSRQLPPASTTSQCPATLTETSRSFI